MNNHKLLYPFSLSIYEFYIVDKQSIRVYDDETDSLITFEPKDERYYVLRMAFYESMGGIFITELIWYKIKCVSETEFNSELYKNLPFREGRYGQ